MDCRLQQRLQDINFQNVFERYVFRLIYNNIFLTKNKLFWIKYIVLQLYLDILIQMLKQWSMDALFLILQSTSYLYFVVKKQNLNFNINIIISTLFNSNENIHLKRKYLHKQYIIILLKFQWLALEILWKLNSITS